MNGYLADVEISDRRKADGSPAHPHFRNVVTVKTGAFLFKGKGCPDGVL